MTKEHLNLIGEVCQQIAAEIADAQNDFFRHRDYYIEKRLTKEKEECEYTLSTIIADYMKMKILNDIILPDISDYIDRFNTIIMPGIEKDIAARKENKDESINNNDSSNE